MRLLIAFVFIAFVRLAAAADLLPSAYYDNTLGVGSAQNQTNLYNANEPKSALSINVQSSSSLASVNTLPTPTLITSTAAIEVFQTFGDPFLAAGSRGRFVFYLKATGPSSSSSIPIHVSINSNWLSTFELLGDTPPYVLSAGVLAGLVGGSSPYQRIYSSADGVDAHRDEYTFLLEPNTLKSFEFIVNVGNRSVMQYGSLKTATLEAEMFLSIPSNYSQYALALSPELAPVPELSITQYLIAGGLILSFLKRRTIAS